MEPTMLERRKLTRSRVFKSAKIILGTASVIDCVVRNITDRGARIEIPNAVTLPEAVDITLDGGHTFRPCRLMWRTLNETGVQFC
jgi:PilZ domain